ncbi:MAG: PEP-CTERM sorting domain-containing protein [Fimbriimonadaceae bacterium]|nr:PEP-CTERM sorting domain-containing protein [Fimbriimonadaceae bacterium]
MRSIALLSLTLAAGAQASFDLVLVADNSGNFAGPTTSKIHRYDGDSGVYLGFIETGFSSINDLAVDSAANEVYVASSNHITVYNIGTGAVNRNFSSGLTNTIRIANGQLYRAYGPSLYSVNKTTGTQALVKTWTSNITDFAFAQNGAYLLYNSAANSLVGFNSAGVQGTSYSAGSIGPNKGRVAFDGSLTNNFYLMGDQDANTTTAFHSGALSAAGTFAVSTGFWSNSFVNSFVDIAGSHNGYYMYGKSNAGDKALYRMFSGIAQGGDRFILTPQVTAPGQIAVVLAPEPGTFIAVGVGVAALLKRRKRR